MFGFFDSDKAVFGGADGFEQTRILLLIFSLFYFKQASNERTYQMSMGL
jgi:hypothetical protein